MTAGKGLFGISGTARDILGTLADGFLVQSGNKAMYGPAKQKEQLSAAMQGFETDPMAAIQRLQEGGFAEEAQAMHKQYQAAQLAAAKEAREVASDVLSNKKTQGEILSQEDKTTRNAVGMFGSANAQNYDAIKKTVDEYAASRGIKLPFTLPEKFDQTAVDTLARFATPIEKIQQMENLEAYRGERLQDADADRAIKESEAENRNTNRDATTANNANRNAETGRSNRVKEGQGERRTKVREAESKGKNDTGRFHNAGKAAVKAPGGLVVQPGQSAVKKNGKWVLIK